MQRFDQIAADIYDSETESNCLQIFFFTSAIHLSFLLESFQFQVLRLMFIFFLQVVGLESLLFPFRLCLSLPDPALADCCTSHPVTGLGHLVDISLSSPAIHFLTGSGRYGFVGQVNGAETSVSSRASAVWSSKTAPKGFQRVWLVAVQLGYSYTWPSICDSQA